MGADTNGGAGVGLPECTHEVEVHAGFDEFAHHPGHGVRMSGVPGCSFQCIKHGVRFHAQRL